MALHNPALRLVPFPPYSPANTTTSMQSCQHYTLHTALPTLHTPYSPANTTPSIQSCQQYTLHTVLPTLHPAYSTATNTPSIQSCQQYSLQVCFVAGKMLAISCRCRNFSSPFPVQPCYGAHTSSHAMGSGTIPCVKAV